MNNDAMRPDQPQELAAELQRTRQVSIDSAYLFRLCCVRLVAAGCDRRRVGDWLGVSPRSVGRWYDAYRRAGLAALRSGLRTGRPGQIEFLDLAQLQQDLAQDPAALGLEGGDWSGEMLRRYLLEQFGIVLSLRQCQRLLPRLRRP